MAGGDRHDQHGAQGRGCAQNAETAGANMENVLGKDGEQHHGAKENSFQDNCLSFDQEKQAIP
ncbi:MAG: hypothetical protein DYG89_51320 [Caldilinea sp. CFX5]|nr:hypothetical protein [Caldilinea sp. CFX5]